LLPRLPALPPGGVLPKGGAARLPFTVPCPGSMGAPGPDMVEGTVGPVDGLLGAGRWTLGPIDAPGVTCLSPVPAGCPPGMIGRELPEDERGSAA